MSKAEHIKFDWSIASVAAMLNTLGVGYSAILNDQQTALNYWPQKEEWAMYQFSLKSVIGELLDQQTQENIETSIIAVEEIFNNYLAGIEPKGTSWKRNMLAMLKEIQDSICQPQIDIHVTYPYFARWFTLHLAALGTLASHRDYKNHMLGIEGWIMARDYLERAHQAAYQERYMQIDMALADDFGDRIYVWDQRFSRALTEEIPAGGQGEIELRNIMASIRREAAIKYIKEIRLNDGMEILTLAHSGISVTADSLITQEQLIEPKIAWKIVDNETPERLSLHEKENETPALLSIHREAHESFVKPDALSPPHVKPVPVKPSTHRKKPTISPIKPSPDPDGSQVFRAIISSLVGSVPIVGTLFSNSTGLLLDWLGGGHDEWIAFENKMKRLLRKSLDLTEARYIRNELNGLDDRLNQFLRDYDDSYRNGKMSRDLAAFQNRIGNLSSNITQFQHHIFRADSPYSTIPYFEHFFLLGVCVNLIGEKLEAPSYNFAINRRNLYTRVERYIEYAIKGLFDERQADIEFKSFDTQCNRRLGDTIFDYRTENKLSEHLFGLPQSIANKLLPPAKSAAALTTVVQLMRMPVKNTILVIEQDTAADFNASNIQATYERAITALYNTLHSDWHKLPSDISPPFRRPGYQLVQAIHDIASMSKETFLDYSTHALPTSNLLYLPGGRTHE